nr:hypothetical protein [Rhizobium sp. CFBP 8762]
MKQVIEYDGEAVGIVIPDNDRLRFMAVKYQVWDLDAHRFHSVDEARAAIRKLMGAQSNAPFVAQSAA